MTVKPPDSDELEISLFGPGYGESILLHIGGDEWVIIDSCIDEFTSRPAAICYLESIGVDPAKSVKLVVATHWHDDHIRGLGETVNLCKNAEFVCSTAIKNREFIQLVEIYRGQGTQHSGTGVSEFLSIFDILKKKGVQPKWAIADRAIWRHPLSCANLSTECHIHSLSPSDQEITKTFKSISGLIPSEGEFPRRVSAPKQNESAVVLWVKIGIQNVFLLGSDLEENGNKQTGWSAVLDSLTSKGEVASVYKVAHHGSITGNHQPVWEEMLEKNALAILTPFTRGRYLPSQDDIFRLNTQTKNAYITTTSNSGLKIKKRDRLVKRFVDKYTRYIKVAELPCGQIKMRKPLTATADGWVIELIGGAAQLQVGL